MNGAHTSSKHQDYSSREPARPHVRPVQTMCDPTCDPHNPTCDPHVRSAQSEQVRTGVAVFSDFLQPTFADL